MEKNKVKVLIKGQEYTLVTAESAEYVQRVAVRVDKTLAGIAEGNKRLSTAMLSMLTSINLADELVRLEDSADNLRKQIAEYSKTELGLRTELSQKSAKINELEEKVHELQIELAKSTARSGY